MKQTQDLYGIKLHCYTKSNKAGEQLITEHGVSFIVSGEMQAYHGNTKHVYREADVVFYKKNALIRFVKYPNKNQEFKAISITLDEPVLRSFSQQYNLCGQKSSKQSLFALEKDKLIDTYFGALESWFGNEISEELIKLKKIELIHLLLRGKKELKNILFDFDLPGKINLEAFMSTHFRFNVSLSQLAFLTGRSLSTFKRDFEKIYRMPPQRWMLQRRLEEAYYLIENKKMKVKDVYLQVGFETLAHFSYAFKNHFGISPSKV
ncbi:helix-turn-helix domain-containing protein [Myroides sp. LJL119]